MHTEYRLPIAEIAARIILVSLNPERGFTLLSHVDNRLLIGRYL